MLSSHALKRLVKQVVRPLIYRFPPVYLSPAGLLLWFDVLRETRAIKGDAVEIGCYLGATSAMSARLLKEMGTPRPYTVIDTFGGFTENQFASELRHGGAPRLRREFSANTPDLARWVMNRHGGAEVQMIVGDIASLPDDALPDPISACLIDIDLAEPIYVALTRIYPRLARGGIIVVDDCDDETLYKARIGYDRFVAEHDLPREITFGKGIVRSPA